MISLALAAEHGGEAASHGGLFADPAFWVSIAFLMVVGFIYIKAKNKILGALDGRGAAVKAKLDEARKLRDDAQALLAEYQRRQRDAMKEADEIIRHAKEEAARLRAKAEADLEASIHRREQQAVDRIAQAEAQALAQVRNEAVDVAVSAARSLLAGSLAKADQNRLLDAAIADLPGKLH
ncbi:F0F1 ATP synthase subunit B [Rhodospirillum rubrum]|uniref:F0F1 ATP synthase subunit B family protein n=1 Tax=Rhodospirillum rubrum TaxID=1085 RepID=UPI001907D8E2|nr:F0F1 ATP synthase subunit B [Rhodospirillum rubrum]MBK1665602.1 F0F1 ATP synthase subunit B [Rhodospirillum rubrum]MBK1677652.1 F0F1 ATP synthase subunit B [Rhodospirillum rubrum]